MIKKKEALSCFDFRNNLRSLFRTPDAGHFGIVDSLRALSFHWVFGFHVLYILRLFVPENQRDTFFQKTEGLTFLWRGTLGVDVFFVISGFLITNLLLKEFDDQRKINIGRFYKRRFLRLMPVYYFSLLVIAVGYHPAYALIQDLPIENVWTNILYINNFWPYEEQYMLWSWSLAVEEQFYLLFPLLLILMLRYKKAILPVSILLLALSVVIRSLVIDNMNFEGGISMSQQLLLDASLPWFNVLYDQIHVRYGALFCGVLLAMIHQRYLAALIGLFNKYSNYAVFFELVLIVLLWFQSVYIPDLTTESGTLYLMVFRTTFSVVLSLLIGLYLIDENKTCLFNKALSSPRWWSLAQLSYANYIWHPMTIFAFLFAFWYPNNALSTAEIIVSIVGSYVATMLLSILSFAAIEKPFMNLRKYV